MLAAFEQACRNARMTQAGELGELTVSFMMHAAHSSVPPLTRSFVAARPQVQLHLRETIPAEILDGVLSGAVDAAISFSPGPVRGIASAVVHSEPLCLAVPDGHRLAEAALVGADDLANEPFICAPAHVVPTLRQAIVDYLAPAGLTPAIRLETQLQQTIVSLVAEGLGIALVPRSLRNLGMRGVVFRDLVDAPVVEQVLLWRPANLNPALPAFLAAAGVDTPAD